MWLNLISLIYFVSVLAGEHQSIQVGYSELLLVKWPLWQKSGTEVETPWPVSIEEISCQILGQSLSLPGPQFLTYKWVLGQVGLCSEMYRQKIGGNPDGPSRSPHPTVRPAWAGHVWLQHSCAPCRRSPPHRPGSLPCWPQAGTQLLGTSAQERLLFSMRQLHWLISKL